MIEDGDRVVADSWAIANYLEDTYPDRPSLFGGAAARAAARFINSWADTVQNPGTATFVAADIVRHLDPRDQDYFLQSRAKRFGMTLEQFCANRDARVAGFRQTLEPLRMTLKSQPFLGGDAPLYPGLYRVRRLPVGAHDKRLCVVGGQTTRLRHGANGCSTCSTASRAKTRATDAPRRRLLPRRVVRLRALSTKSFRCYVRRQNQFLAFLQMSTRAESFAVLQSFLLALRATRCVCIGSSYHDCPA